MDCIPKQIFIVWFGNNCPTYIKNVVHAYREANEGFDVRLIHYSIDKLKSIYLGRSIERIEDDILVKAIDVVLDNDNKYRDVLDKCFFYYAFMHQKDQYGDNMRVIQVLSDIYRLMLIDKLGGIYVDADTFPMKPFDDSILRLDNFTVARHYGGKNVHTIDTDNYFLGSKPNALKCAQTKLVQTNDNWWIDIQHIIRKQAFFKNCLKYTPQLDQPFYIEHFFENNWILKNGIIKTPICFLDQIYKERNTPHADR